MPPIENDLTPEEQALFAAGGSAQSEENQQGADEGQQQGQQAGEQGADQGQQGAQGQGQAQDAAGQGEGDSAGQQGQEGQQGQGQQQDNRMVPHAAMHQERMRANQLAQQLAQATARMNAMLEQQRRQQAENIPPLPDLEENPVEYIRQLESRIAAFEQAWREEDDNRRLDTALEQDENVFTASTPDYPEASAYYVRSRAQELLQFYSPEQAQQIMVREARQIAQESWRRGTPAAAAIYNMAQLRGYRPGAGQQGGQGQGQQANGQQRPGNGQQRPGAAATVDAINRGQQASRSLSAGAGGAPATQLNAEALLAMSDEEFERHLKLGQRGADDRFAEVAGR